MRLIDGDALYEKARDLEAQALDYTIKISHEAEKCRMWAVILTERSAFKHDVYDAPTIKPEPEIVRCKDCKHRDPEDKKCDCGHDILWQLPRQDDWYCADAERRTDG